MIYNFGSSHATGMGYSGQDVYPASHSYSKVLAKNIKTDVINYAVDGSGLEYSIMEFMRVKKSINDDDIILFQINANPNYVMRINADAEIYNINSMTQLLRDDTYYGKALVDGYVNDVFNPADFYLHYAILISMLLEVIRNSKFKTFVYFCKPIESKFTTGAKFQIPDNDIINSVTFEDYVKLHCDDIYADDGAHFSKQAHAAWAAYIQQEIGL